MSSKLLAVLAAGLGLAALSSTLHADDMHVAHVVVEGPMDRVYEFHQNLKALIAATQVTGDLATAGVDCNYSGADSQSCDELKDTRDANAPVVSLEYIIYREHLSAFVLAWDKLEDRAHADVSMKFDMRDIGTADCLSPATAKQPCTNAVMCPAQTPRRCDKAAGPPCTSCGVP